jgi:thiol:disulfide interchange protein
MALPFATVAAEPAPRVSVASIQALPTPLPYPYDEKANAAALMAEAFAKARRSGKRVLVDFGGNWCPDCRILAGVLNLPEVRAYVTKHYEVVTVDVGRLNRNPVRAERLGIRELSGVPTVVIADASGKPLNITNSADLSNARGMSPQGIVDWLAQWTSKK